MKLPQNKHPALSADDIRSERELMYQSSERIQCLFFFLSISLFLTSEVMKMMNCALSLWFYFLCLCGTSDGPWHCEGRLCVTQRKLHRKNAVVVVVLFFFYPGWHKVWQDKMTKPILCYKRAQMHFLGENIALMYIAIYVLVRLYLLLINWCKWSLFVSIDINIDWKELIFIVYATYNVIIY